VNPVIAMATALNVSMTNKWQTTWRVWISMATMMEVAYVRTVSTTQRVSTVNVVLMVTTDPSMLLLSRPMLASLVGVTQPSLLVTVRKEQEDVSVGQNMQEETVKGVTLVTMVIPTALSASVMSTAPETKCVKWEEASVPVR